MTIFVKNKHTLQVDEFLFKCCVGKKGTTDNKKEGDNKTPKGIFEIGDVYYRHDRRIKPKTSLKCIAIQKNMGWCDDIRFPKKYIKHEKLKRNDYKYNYLIPIKYNFIKPIIGLGSCIFIHLTKNYRPTAGCIALKEKDFLIMIRIIKKNTKIKIY